MPEQNSEASGLDPLLIGFLAGLGAVLIVIPLCFCIAIRGRKRWCRAEDDAERQRDRVDDERLRKRFGADAGGVDAMFDAKDEEVDVIDHSVNLFIDVEDRRKAAEIARGIPSERLRLPFAQEPRRVKRRSLAMTSILPKVEEISEGSELDSSNGDGQDLEHNQRAEDTPTDSPILAQECGTSDHGQDETVTREINDDTDSDLDQVEVDSASDYSFHSSATSVIAPEPLRITSATTSTLPSSTAKPPES